MFFDVPSKKKKEKQIFKMRYLTLVTKLEFNRSAYQANDQSFGSMAPVMINHLDHLPQYTCLLPKLVRKGAELTMAFFRTPAISRLHISDTQCESHRYRIVQKPS